MNWDKYYNYDKYGANIGKYDPVEFFEDNYDKIVNNNFNFNSEYEKMLLSLETTAICEYDTMVDKINDLIYNTFLIIYASEINESEQLSYKFYNMMFILDKYISSLSDKLLEEINQDFIYSILNNKIEELKILDIIDDKIINNMYIVFDNLSIFNSKIFYTRLYDFTKNINIKNLIKSYIN